MTAVGFTGSRWGASSEQLVWLEDILSIAIETGVTEFHHGDCMGADEAAHKVALNLGIKIVIHPPDRDILRAFCTGENVEIREPKPYKDRDRDIVHETVALYATPEGPEADYPRSGTWYTIRQAVKAGRFVYVCLPDGTLLP